MTPAAADASLSSPWLSVWFNPRRTIDRVLATNPKRHVLLLAALGAISDLAIRSTAFFGLTRAFLDWRIVAALVLIGAVAGVLTLYIGSCFLKWGAKPFGGRATLGTIRAALAWGAAPFAVGVPIYLVIFIGLSLSGLANAAALNIALEVAAVALGLWALIWTLLMYARVQSFGFFRAIVSVVFAWFLLLLIPLVIRIFFFQPFSIPASSMMPTLLVGDHLFVAKYSYGYTHYSLPFSPRLFPGRFWASEPRLGDVVVFRLPKDDSVDYIKRIVGLPGDRVQMINGVLQINGQAVKHERVDDFVTEDNGAIQRVRRYRETLPNGVSYTTLDLTDNGFYDNTPVYTVPPGHYFMLGDNLDNSTDSRVLSQVGYVPFENLVGRAGFIYFSVDETSHTGQPRIRFERIGTIVR